MKVERKGNIIKKRISYKAEAKETKKKKLNMGFIIRHESD